MLFQGSLKYYRIIDGISDFEQMPRLARFINLSVVHRLPNLEFRLTVGDR
ncbi:hypothetical protein [Nostoc flagelliforme]|nr:hypothetical protein [Nostoc flagelliforme]